MLLLPRPLYLGLVSLLLFSLQSEMHADDHKNLQTPQAFRSILGAGSWYQGGLDDDADDDDDSEDGDDNDEMSLSQIPPAKKPQSKSSQRMSSGLQRDTPYDGRPQKGLQVWGNIDYLLWWTKDAPIAVPLITTGSTTDLHPAAIGQPNTRVLYGNHGIDYGAQSGFRAAARTWFDDSKRWGLEASGLLLPKQLHTHKVYGNPNGFPILGVPFNNTTVATTKSEGGWSQIDSTGEVALLINTPAHVKTDGLFGDISVRATTELWDAELNGLYNFYAKKRFHLSALAGFLYVDLQDSLSLETATIQAPPSTATLEGATTMDQFRTHNSFYGGQLGIEGEWSYRWIFARAIGKVGLGAMRQGVHIHGYFSDGDPILFNNFGQGPGGIFTQNTNIGNRHKYKFAVVPEGFFQFGLNLFKNLRLAVGYNFMYLSSVVRAGDQIDHTINETQAGANNAGGESTLVGPARPEPKHVTTSYWAQGINIGIEFRF